MSKDRAKAKIRWMKERRAINRKIEKANRILGGWVWQLAPWEVGKEPFETRRRKHHEWHFYHKRHIICNSASCCAIGNRHKFKGINKRTYLLWRQYD